MKYEVKTSEDWRVEIHGQPTHRAWETEPDHNGEHHVIVTGPKALGDIQLSDGTTYDVTPEFIQVPAEHIDEVVAEIRKLT
jgi:hypothetical protein